tara:strand:- start:512 stop:841 length:330 start_codon:yes stop_codon:yes gene_type:complete
MAQFIHTIRKRTTFLLIRKKGKMIKGKTFNIILLKDLNLENKILVGYTATKRIGNAIKRNKAKRIMRELSRKIIAEYGKINTYYVMIAKSSIFDIPFISQKNELKKLIS